MSVDGVTFGQAISKARKSLGLSQKELASQVKKEEDGTSISLRWIPKWLTGFPRWILLFLSRIHPEGQITSRNQLLLNYFTVNASRGGFRLDSPVKKPVASEMPRCAPPYTDWAREEPWEGVSQST